MNDKSVKLSRRTLLVGSAALAGSWNIPAFSAPANLRAAINTQIASPALSPMLYGGFIEHIGNLINHSLWSEVLDDRKFFFGVIEKPETKPEDARAAMRFIRKWVAIGSMSAIQLDSSRPYVGEHSPVVTVNGVQKNGIAQHELSIRSSTSYNGRVVVWADSGVTVFIKLVWGDAPEQTLSQKISTSKKWKAGHLNSIPRLILSPPVWKLLPMVKGVLELGLFH